MDATADERLRAAVREYLEAVDRLAALEPTILQRMNCHGDAVALKRACRAAADVHASLRGLRHTYRDCGGDPSDGAEVAPPTALGPSEQKLADAVPAPLNQWPLRSGQRV